MNTNLKKLKSIEDLASLLEDGTCKFKGKPDIEEIKRISKFCQIGSRNSDFKGLNGIFNDIRGLSKSINSSEGKSTQDRRIPDKELITKNEKQLSLHIKILRAINTRMDEIEAEEESNLIV
jgi:hypothetical protein